MAISLTATGLEISTERYFIKATSSDPTVKSVQLKVYVEGYTGLLHTLEQGPDLGTTNEFTFEINQILKPYFEWAFHTLGVTAAFEQLNVLSTLVFTEFDGTNELGTTLTYYNLKNMTFTPIEVNDLDLDTYDMSSGTGNKFLTSGPSELHIPDKRQFWMSILKSGQSTSIPAVFSEVGTYTYGSGDYLDIVDGGLGAMYLIPYNATDVIKFDPILGTFTPIATGGLNAAAYVRAVKAQNGKIYCIPYLENRVMVIDPATDAITFITGAGTLGAVKYFTAAEVNGILYCSPQSLGATLIPILFIDTSVDAIAFSSGSYAGYGGCVAFGNAVYFFPVTGVVSPNILRYITTSDTASITGTLTGYGFNETIFLNTATNQIYAIPVSGPVGAQIVKVDATTGVPSFIGPVITPANNITGAIGSDGTVYCMGAGTDVLNLDMNTETVQILSTTPGSNYQGSDLFSTDGNIYGIPASSLDGNVLKIAMPTIGADQELVVEAFNPSGISLGTTTYDILVDQRAPINPFAPSGVGPLGTYDIWVKPLTIDSASSQKTLQVWVRDKVGGTIRSEVKTFVNQNYGLSYCRGYRIHWLNEFGTQDSYTFNGRLTKVLETQVKDYENVDIGTLVYYGEYAEEWEVTTLEESPEVVEWLVKMFRNKRAVLEQLVPNVNPKYFDIEILQAEKQISDNLRSLTEFTLRFRFSKTSRAIQ